MNLRIKSILSLGDTTMTSSSIKPDLHVADPAADFPDTVPPAVESQVLPGEDAPRVSKVPAPKYAIFKDQIFERSIAADRDEVMAQVGKQVRISQAPIVYVYELVAAVCFEPTAVVIEPEQIAERLNASE